MNLIAAWTAARKENWNSSIQLAFWEDRGSLGTAPKGVRGVSEIACQIHTFGSESVPKTR